MNSTGPQQRHPLHSSSLNSCTHNNNGIVFHGEIDNALKDASTKKHRCLLSDLRAIAEGVNYGHPDSYEVLINDKPEWLDVEKFKFGQKFAMKHFIGVTFCEVLSLIMYFLIQDIVVTLKYTGNTSTPFKSYKRYLSTVLRVNSWFEDDIWDTKSKGYRNLVTVRMMHLNVSRKINSESDESLKEKLTKESFSNCPLYEDLKEDFKSLCPVFGSSPDFFRDQKLHVNQCEMSLIQFVTFGLLILYPEKFGAAHASTEELDGLVHMWRVLGYYLGIDDRFNFCHGTIDEVKERCKNVLSYWFKPSFSDITQDWEHISRCLAEGASYYILGVSFEVMVLYLCWVLDIEAPRLYSSLTWKQKIMFNIIKFIMCVALRIPGLLVLFNLLLHWALDRAHRTLPDKLLESESL